MWISFKLFSIPLNWQQGFWAGKQTLKSRFDCKQAHITGWPWRVDSRLSCAGSYLATDFRLTELKIVDSVSSLQQRVWVALFCKGGCNRSIIITNAGKSLRFCLLFFFSPACLLGSGRSLLLPEGMGWSPNFRFVKLNRINCRFMFHQQRGALNPSWDLTLLSLLTAAFPLSADDDP